MSVFSEALRAAVVERAKQRCEYCHLPIQGQVGRFPIDHVLPRTAGGMTDLSNLALACPHCNARKWCHTQHADPVTGEHIALFNPRAQHWDEHFGWSDTDSTELVAKTPCARATIALLEMNHETLRTTRALLARLELFPNS